MVLCVNKSFFSDIKLLMVRWRFKNHFNIVIEFLKHIIDFIKNNKNKYVKINKNVNKSQKYLKMMI